MGGKGREEIRVGGGKVGVVDGGILGFLLTVLGQVSEFLLI